MEKPQVQALWLLQNGNPISLKELTKNIQKTIVKVYPETKNEFAEICWLITNHMQSKIEKKTLIKFKEKTKKLLIKSINTDPIHLDNIYNYRNKSVKKKEFEEKTQDILKIGKTRKKL